MTKILITDGLSADAVDTLKATPGFEVEVRKSTPASELATIIGGYDCVIIRSATTLTKDLIEAGRNLKLIVRAGAGVDNIDVPTATARKVPVMNTASANANAAAEQTIALMFAMLRFVPQAYVSMREGRWDRESFKGFEAEGKTLGVVGLGAIGKMVAKKALGLGMTVVGYDPVTKGVDLHGLKVVNSLDELLAASNIVTLHVPKTKDTAGLLNGDRIAKLRKGSFVINCARGGIVDEAAVVAALNSGHLAGAAFDVFEKEPPARFDTPLFQHPKVVFVPHLGASTVEAQERVGATAAKQIVGFFSRGERTGILN